VTPFQSALDPGARQAASIAWLWWGFLALLATIFVVVIATALWTLTRRHRGINQEPLERVHSPSTATEASLTRWVGGATIVTVVLIFGLIVSSVLTGKAISKPVSKQPALTIELVGNQWWWYVRYLDRDPTQVLVTANEIHIPVGRPVLIRGTSHDVIHSFWVPNLNGKRDLIPSRVGEEWIEAEKPGRYRGQCAEFCGLQHAHMALWVIAEPNADFEKWKQAQLPCSRAHGPASCPWAASVPLERGRDVPFHSRHARIRTGRARPYALRQPHDHRGGHAAEQPRQSRGLDFGPAEY